MAFYQGSLEGCSPPPPTAQLPLTEAGSVQEHIFQNAPALKVK